MICHFENITMKLTPAERRLIPGLIDIIYRTNSENRIKTPQVVEELRISGTDSQLKQKRSKALPLGESMTSEAQPISYAVGG